MNSIWFLIFLPYSTWFLSQILIFVPQIQFKYVPINPHNFYKIRYGYMLACPHCSIIFDLSVMAVCTIILIVHSMYILQCSIDTLHVDYEWCILQCSIDTLHVDCGTVLVISSFDSFYCEQIHSKSNDFGLVYTILLECIKSAFTLYAWWHRQLRNVFECLY